MDYQQVGALGGSKMKTTKVQETVVITKHELIPKYQTRPVSINMALIQRNTQYLLIKLTCTDEKLSVN